MIRPTNEATDWRVEARSSGSTMASSAASMNGMSISRPNCSMRSMVVLPTPRRGTLITRFAAMSSAGFTTSVR